MIKCFKIAIFLKYSSFVSSHVEVASATPVLVIYITDKQRQARPTSLTQNIGGAADSSLCKHGWPGNQFERSMYHGYPNPIRTSAVQPTLKLTNYTAQRGYNVSTVIIKATLGFQVLSRHDLRCCPLQQRL